MDRGLTDLEVLNATLTRVVKQVETLTHYVREIGDAIDRLGLRFVSAAEIRARRGGE